jgi:cytochrome P450
MSLDPFSPTTTEERHETLARMRVEAGVHKLPTGQWFAISAEAVETGLKSVEHFVGSFGDAGDLPEEKQILAGIPEPRHGKIRKIINSVFAYHHASAVEGWALALSERLVEGALAESGAKGSVCLMQGLARPLPSAVIAHLLGVPSEDHATFARWSDEVLAGAQSDMGSRPAGAELSSIHSEFGDYIREQVAVRKDDPNAPDDLTTRLLNAEVDGERLSETAVRTQLQFLIMAGNETTRNLIGNMLKHLAGLPELYRALREDRELLVPISEEVLRVDTPVQLLARTCTRPIVLDGVQVEAGERVLFHVGAANRDPARFADPTQMNPGRERVKEHLGFGAGPHICPGAFLARMETRVAFEAFLDRVQAFELAPSHRPDQNPVFWANGPQSLRVVLERA